MSALRDSAPARHYRNDAPRGGAGNWLRVRAVDPTLRRDALGATVEVRAGGRRLVREVALAEPGSAEAIWPAGDGIPGSRAGCRGARLLPASRGAGTRRLPLALPRGTGDGQVHGLLGQVYRRLGRAAEAERELLRAGAHPGATRGPDPIVAEMEAEAVGSRAHSKRGRRLAEEGRFAEAEAEFRRVIEIRPANVRDLSNLGGALAGQGELNGAIAEFEKALALDSNDTVLATARAGRGELDGRPVAAAGA